MTAKYLGCKAFCCFAILWASSDAAFASFSFLDLQELIDSGLDVAVMGTALFRAPDMPEAIRRIHGMKRSTEA